MNKEEIIKQAEELLDQLDDYKIGVDMLSREKARLIDEAIPPEVKATLADIEAEFRDKLLELNTEIEQLEIILKHSAVQIEETIKSDTMMVVYSKPRATWDTKGLEGYMVAHPEIEQFRKTSAMGSASIRRR